MILIIESGSTKTNWRLINLETGKSEDFSSKGINPYFETAEAILASQQEILSLLSSKSIQKIAYYGTGITGIEQKNIIRQLVESHFKEAKNIIIENDLCAAAHAAIGLDSGIVCILGTGANSGYFQHGQLIEQIPPLGFWLGDEGSGGYLGKSLVLSYLHQEMPNEIREKFIKRFGELNRLDVLQKAYQEPYPNRWFASFSKFLFDHRKEEFCFNLIRQSFELFIEQYLLRYSTIQDVKVHFTGSVAFYYSDILRKLLARYSIQIGTISESPMAGLTAYYKGSV